MIQSTKIRIFSQVKNTFPEVKKPRIFLSEVKKSKKLRQHHRLPQNPEISKIQNLVDSLGIILCVFD